MDAELHREGGRIGALAGQWYPGLGTPGGLGTAPAPASASALASAPVPARIEPLRSAAVERRAPPAIPPEAPLTAENRVLEVRQYWGESLLGVHHFPATKKQITLGENKRADFFIATDGLPSDDFPLVRVDEGRWILSLCAAMSGEVERDGRRDSVPTLCRRGREASDPELHETYNVELSPEARAVVHWGGATFAMRFVPAPQSFLKGRAALDFGYLNAALVMLFVHVSLVGTLLLFPSEVNELRQDLFETKVLASCCLVMPPPKDPIVLRPKVPQPEPRPAATGPNPAATLAENPTRPSDLRTSDNIKQRAVQMRIRNMFALGSTQPQLGPGGGGLGGSLRGALVNVIGTNGQGSTAGGLAGMGLRGNGAELGGGPGPVSRSIAGGTAAILRGLPPGGEPGMGRRKQPVVDLALPTASGNMDPSLVQRVINEHKNQIRFCYERELQRDQALEGRLALTWDIGPDGRVRKAAIGDSTINNAAVEQCVLEHVKSWKFPEPMGGGSVTVNYPFILHSS